LYFTATKLFVKQFIEMKNKIYTFFLLFFTFFAKSQSKYQQNETVKTVNNFIAKLNNEQKVKTLFSFDAKNRTEWTNLPIDQKLRLGIGLSELSDEQKIALHQILRTVLSPEGYQKALFIIQYDEDTHQRLASTNSPIAHLYGQQKYWTSVFGEPVEGKNWGFKFEGHHLSLNFTFSSKGVTCTPMFTGINPALTSMGPFAGRYIMEPENEIGNALFNSLTDSQKNKVIIGTHPTNADPMAQTGKEAFFNEEKGLLFTEMTKNQQDLVIQIMHAWAGNLNANFALEKTNSMLRNINNIRFCWLGENDPNKLHYYRIYAPNFSFEFTNRDGGIQHFHSLWRFLDEDFKVK
jgi:Protein of unknown function (DUF3500)